jgi:predicted metal-binding membrane protein
MYSITVLITVEIILEILEWKVLSVATMLLTPILCLLLSFLDIRTKQKKKSSSNVKGLVFYVF